MKKQKFCKSLAALSMVAVMTFGTSMTAFAKIDYGTPKSLKECGVTDADIERLDRWANYTSTGEIKGVTYPKTTIDIGNGFQWKNSEGGTE